MKTMDELQKEYYEREKHYKGALSYLLLQLGYLHDRYAELEKPNLEDYKQLEEYTRVVLAGPE